VFYELVDMNRPYLRDKIEDFISSIKNGQKHKQELAEEMGFKVLHGIVDCLWVIGEPISAFKEAVERYTGILTEVDSYDWFTFLPMSDGGGAYNRYFGRLNGQDEDPGRDGSQGQHPRVCQ
jgi:hypothetical protein